jgi:hypothetical protein
MHEDEAIYPSTNSHENDGVPFYDPLNPKY